MLLAPADPRGDADARRVREGLAAGAPGEGARALPERVDALYAADDALWPALDAALGRDPRSLDRLLLRVHYRRGDALDAGRRERVLRFLTLGYARTGDVRWLNEFLWFHAGGAEGYAAASRLTFRENVGPDGCHRFPLAAREEMARDLRALAAAEAPPAAPRLPARVAVLGPPHAFAELYDALRAEGCAPAVFDFPAAGRGWRGRLKANPLLRRAYYAARRCRVPYRAVTYPPAEERVGRMVAEAGAPVAVHQLPFIIRANLIGAFPVGILNDHLGVLPFVRGRSSLEFSLLYGLPPASTLHFVDEGVDTGPLLRAYVYAPAGEAGVEALKTRVLRARDARLLDVLRDLGGGGRRTLVNPPEKGLQHFTMHPSLVRWVDARVLPGVAGAAEAG